MEKIQIRETDEFKAWIRGLKDKIAQSITSQTRDIKAAKRIEKNLEEV